MCEMEVYGCEKMKFFQKNACKILCIPTIRKELFGRRVRNAFYNSSFLDVTLKFVLVPLAVFRAFAVLRASANFISTFMCSAHPTCSMTRISQQTLLLF